MDKPEIGSVIGFHIITDVDEGPMKGRVAAVYDSLDEDWENDGHAAMAIADSYSKEQLKEAEWFAIVENEDGWTGVASFEVKED